MSGEGLGILVVPVVICIAAPIVVTGLAVAGVGALAIGVTKAGSKMITEHQKRQEEKQRQLADSGLEPQILNLYGSLVNASQKMAGVYNAQSQRIANGIEQRHDEWVKSLQSDIIMKQVEFDRRAQEFREGIVAYEQERAQAFSKQIGQLTDAQDKELAKELQEIDRALQKKMEELKQRMDEQVQAGQFYADRYYESAKTLLQLLMEDYHGERFCTQEIAGIKEMMGQSRDKLDTAPQAAYAIIWNTVERTLLAIHKADQMYQEWVTQYAVAISLAEEVRLVLEHQELGYLVDGVYAKDIEEAQRFCEAKGISQDNIQTLKANEYVYGELEQLKQQFEDYCSKLYENGGEGLSIEELYTIIDDLNILFGTKAQSLQYEASMRLNEALLIDRMAQEINDALKGSYHYAGSANVGNSHIGEKHILFVRDGNPKEQMCVILREDGWDKEADGQVVYRTGIDILSVKDNHISEQKRQQIRQRLCGYLNQSIPESKTEIKCVPSTRGKLTNRVKEANLSEVSKQKNRRRIAH